ncbi:conserved hypothetical protein (plasmid) [Ralstonia solanacearum Po82]|uniref:Uncharacterized protein n=1 Tax=Ralstonia solanacearum (strain Po82) TaxID=1031711 RepID=F6G9K8_RALS8|nr:conserved hypothetical protein [Ralstonia solanacearum Po82]
MMKGLKRLPPPASIALLLPVPGRAQDRAIASPQAACPHLRAER